MAERQINCAASLRGKSLNTPNEDAHSISGGDCDTAIAKATAAVTHVQSQSQEVSSRDERLGLFGFYLSSEETDFWWLEDDSRDYASHYRVSYGILCSS